MPSFDIYQYKLSDVGGSSAKVYNWVKMGWLISKKRKPRGV